MKLSKQIIAITLALGLVSSASAQRANDQPFANKTYQKATSVEAITGMEKGSRYALVCTECDSVTIKEAGDKKELEEMCHDGGTVHCPSCKKKFTVQTSGPRPGATPAVSKVTIVNAEGKECMFVVPLKA